LRRQEDLRLRGIGAAVSSLEGSSVVGAGVSERTRVGVVERERGESGERGERGERGEVADEVEVPRRCSRPWLEDASGERDEAMRVNVERHQLRVNAERWMREEASRRQ
jgi:hypothetical protein